MSSRRHADRRPDHRDNKRPRTDDSDRRDRGRGNDKPAFDVASVRAQIAARKAEAEAKLAAIAKPAGPAAMPPKPSSSSNSGSESTADRLAAAKARLQALNAKVSNNPYSSGSGALPGNSNQAGNSGKPAAVAPQLSSLAGLHPLLMGDSGSGNAQDEAERERNEKKAMRERYKTMAPKFSTVKANQASVAQNQPIQPVQPTPSLNPYASASSSAPAAPQSVNGQQQSAKLGERRNRVFQFAKPGRFVEQGDQLRNEAKMEALRQRIAEASKKAGLDSEFDTLEKSLKRQPPPEVEWWDEAILPPGTKYDDLSTTMDFLETSQDSLITHLIQHPIPLAAPMDKKLGERGLMLTKKEQKKMRRQRRMAELEDKRDRQKMGLLPPDPPKVRLANLMKVLTSDAVQDPTKVEAKVRREVAARATKHEADNADRKLTPEQRKEKENELMAKREKQGLHAAVFKIKYLSNGRHKFKVRETAKTDLLTGLCIFGKDFAIVLVEGVDKSIKHYKKLMLNRIDWTERARPLNKEGEGGGGKEGSDDDMKDSDDEGEKGDLDDNKCELIWEGEVPERNFNGFRAKHAETDNRAKELLRNKWEGMWDLAKRWQWQGEEL